MPENTWGHGRITYHPQTCHQHKEHAGPCFKSAAALLGTLGWGQHFCANMQPCSALALTFQATAAPLQRPRMACQHLETKLVWEEQRLVMLSLHSHFDRLGARAGHG